MDQQNCFLGDRLLAAVETTMRDGYMIAQGYYREVHFKIKTRVIFLDDYIVDKIANVINSEVRDENVNSTTIRDAIAEMLYKEKRMRIKVKVKRQNLKNNIIQWYVELSK